MTLSSGRPVGVASCAHADSVGGHGGLGTDWQANVRLSWDMMFALAEEGESGLAELTSIFHLCHPLTSRDDVMALAYWIAVSEAGRTAVPGR